MIFMMILADRDILKRIKEKSLVIKPFSKKRLQPSTYDLLLSGEIRIFNSHDISVVDVKKSEEISRRVKLRKNGSFIIHPGEFILGSTVEFFEIPLDMAAKLEGRSSLGRLGLIIHATAGYVDPGFKGYLTFEMSNISRLPIKLYPRMRVAQICFFQMTSQVLRPYGSREIGSKYQFQKGPTASRAWKDFRQNEK
jgi:dCTP deaminase